MKASRLRNPYVAVMREGALSYGGSQSWSENAMIQKYGCGVAAGTDLLLYLSLYKESCASSLLGKMTEGSGILETEQYLECAKKMRHSYFPVIPYFGMPGWLLCASINRYFQCAKIPLKASFGVLGRNIWNRISAMLAHDIPVILAVGPNFPIPWKRHKLALYEKNGKGQYLPAAEICAHFVTVTGMDEAYMKVSSWGREYYIDREEFVGYVRKYSSFLVSNVCYIRKR